MRTRTLLAAAGLVLAGAVAVAVVVATRDHDRHDGPIGYPGNGEPVRLALSLPLAVGRPVSTGILVVQNRGPGSVTLVRAGPDRLDAGMAVLGVYVRRYPDPRGIIGLDYGYDPSSGRPLAGYVVRPHAELALVLGAKLTVRGEHLLRGLRLTYTDGAHHYKEVFPLSLRLCAPAAQYKERCETARA